MDSIGTRPNNILRLFLLIGLVILNVFVYLQIRCHVEGVREDHLYQQVASAGRTFG